MTKIIDAIEMCENKIEKFKEEINKIEEVIMLLMMKEMQDILREK